MFAGALYSMFQDIHIDGSASFNNNMAREGGTRLSYRYRRTFVVFSSFVPVKSEDHRQEAPNSGTEAHSVLTVMRIVSPVS